MKRLIIPTILFSFVFSYPKAQIKSSGGNDIDATIQSRLDHLTSSPLSSYPVRSIGPVVQGGRISDIEVVPNNPKEFYVGYASGGIFYTRNNGISFEPVFDNQGVLGIGDFALAPSNPKVIYVGTGEKNSSRSSYAGSGVYRSDDGGKTWKHVGLTNTQHIGKVLVHPTNPETVWVASIGTLYSNNADRGVYKSTDGGKTWTKTLFINDSTGVIDLILNPKDPDQLWASSWERSRKAWDFKESGPGSTIYRSEDGGNTWVKSAQGFPSGNGVGRIGLDISPANPNVIYAFLDNQEKMKSEAEPATASQGLKVTDFISMTKDQFLALDDKKLDDFIKNNFYPRKYDAKLVKKEVREGKYAPKALAEYLGDPNEEMVNTEVKGAELYRSDDGGKTWKMANTYKLEGVYYTYGYYFGEVRVDPNDPQTVYVFGVPFLKSKDGGKTYMNAANGQRVHSDMQELWIDPVDSDHLLLGCDGGLYQSYDGGDNWRHINNTAVGQFYSISVDMEKPYNVYGGLQDNGVKKGSSQSVPNQSQFWDNLFGGDGMMVFADPRNSNTVYAGSQFGFYMRLSLDGGRPARITPSGDIGEDRLRYNWRTPILLSPHNPDIIYMAAQKLYRSVNQGNDWEAISGDLTKNLPNGDVPYSTISCLSESPLRFGLIYVGTDDGNIQITKNGGGSWDLVSSGLPEKRWVSSVNASPHDEGTVFVTLNGYRNDEFKTYIYKSVDYGKTWNSIKGNLPESVANVVIQDPVEPALLYAGLDIGTYVSMDGGKNWDLLAGVPNAPSYDMVVHPRDKELVVGTHGRSAYVADAKPLEKVTKSGVNTAIIAFEMESVRYSDRWGQKRAEYADPFLPEASTLYYVGTPVAEVSVVITTEKGEMINQLKADGSKGFHTFTWDLKKMEYDKKGKPTGQTSYIGRGKYKVEFRNGASMSAVFLEVK